MTLRAEDIAYSWKFRGGEVAALHSFTAEFSPGLPHIVCGPSGSGKSTLSLLLAGLLTANEGRVVWDDRPVEDRRAEIAYVFQFPENIFFADTVAEELEQISGADTSYFDLLGVNFDVVKRQHPFHLSAGYGRLTAIAMQLARHPKLLILDEPTIGLDWKFRSRLLGVLRNWCSDQRLLILVTHDLEVLHELGGKSWVLSGGQLAWSGDMHSLLENPALLQRYGLES